MPTTTLVTRLRSDPEAPWRDHGPAGITPMRLAAMLRDYDIRSANIRFPEPFGQVKGITGRFHRRMGALLPLGPGGAVPAVPSVPAQLSPGTT